MENKIQKIVYASDLSENSKPALEWAMMIANRHDAQITFLHVIEEASTHAAQAIRSFMGEDKWQQMMAGYVDDANKTIEERIRRFCDEVHGAMETCPNAVTQTIVKHGVPVEMILETSHTQEADLIVTGTRGAGLIKDAMIGSTARRVLRRSKIPVLVIPLSSEDA